MKGNLREITYDLQKSPPNYKVTVDIHTAIMENHFSYALTAHQLLVLQVSTSLYNACAIPVSVDTDTQLGNSNENTQVHVPYPNIAMFIFDIFSKTEQ